MKNEKISIVIPIYNVEEYLAKCLNTILGQTYSNIEILLINDGSPDNSGIICDDYVDKDTRIKVYHIPNGGVAKARQYGVENSTGDYIVFVDPDDWLPKNAIELLYSEISNDVDLVIGGHITNYNKREKYNSPTPQLLNTEQYLSLLIAWEIEIGPWAKLFRRKLFTNNSFPSVKHTQDLLMNIEVGTRIKSVKIIKDIVYCYLVRQGSTARTFKGSFEYEKNFCKLVKKILTDNNMYNQFAISYSKLVLQVMYRPVIYGIRINIKDPIIVEALQILKNSKCSITTRLKRSVFKYYFMQRLLSLAYKFKQKFAN